MPALEEEYRVVLSSISDAVFITDDAGYLTFICPNVHVIFGYSVDEVREMARIDRLIGPDLLNPAELAAADEIHNREHHIRDRHGRLHTLLINIKRVAIRAGTRLYTCRDITARKEMERSLDCLQADLAHASRLSTIGELTSGLAHELNQPLAAISNYAQACYRRVRSGVPCENLLDALEQIVVQAHRAADVIQHVRSFIKKRPPTRTSSDVATLISDAQLLVRPTVERHGVLLVTELADGLPPVQADVVGIQQVLINLVCNAVEATVQVADGHSPVRIEACRRDDTGEVEVAVIDAGPGVTASVRDRIFDPFFTTKPDGTGLGLSISQSVIAAHGGRLWVETNEHGGATFRFRLPVAGEPPVRPEIGTSSVVTPRVSGQRTVGPFGMSPKTDGPAATPPRGAS